MRILAEVNERNGRAAAAQAIPAKLETLLFDKQQRFLYDPAKRKAALCSRRAGKTFCCALYLCMVAMAIPDSVCVYIALSRKNARRLLWPVLKRLNRDQQLGLTFNDVELEARLPNGSQIWLTGANDRSEIEKLRGEAYPLAVLDESASFGPYLEELVEDVLEPAMLDYDGTLCMIGTPAAHCTGKFFDATMDPTQGWSVHQWTVLDNPHIPNAKAWLDERMQRKNWTDTHPTYLREWRGRWVRSAESMVYRWSDGAAFSQLPSGCEWEYVIGVDLGFEDATAFVIEAFSRDRPDVYVVDEFKRSKLIPSDIAAQLREYVSTYNPISIVCDTGGLGKSIAEELSQRYAMNIKPANKAGKLANIELLNGDLDAGLFRARADSALVGEWKTLQWDEDRKKEDSRFDNHLSDAALYAYRECKHYTHQPKAKEPGPDEVEFHERRALEYERQLERQVEADEEEWGLSEHW